MPFGLNNFQTAKENAKERLSKWIDTTKEIDETQSGIARLQKNHKNLFKRIEWKPKVDQVGQNVEESTRLETRKTNFEDMDMMTPHLASLFQIHDSNSSNVSSRLQSRREEIKYSETQTPLPKTPFSRLGSYRTIDKTEKIQQDVDVTDKTGKPPPEINKKLTIPLQFPGKRRRRRTNKTVPDQHAQAQAFLITVTGHDQQQQQQQQQPSLDVPVGMATHRLPSAGLHGRSQLNLTPSSVSILKKKSSTYLGDLVQSMAAKNSAKIAVDSILKRSLKPHKHGRVTCVSKMELAATEEEAREMSKEERRLEVLRRFRKMVRLLIHVRVLLNVSRIRIEEEEKSKGFKRFEGGTELSFDPTMYKTAMSYGGLTSRARKALKKNPGDRNEEDARILMEVMLRMSVFIKYPKSVRQDLARVMWYDQFKEGRVIVKQGDPGTRMYFVVSGEVDLKRTDKIDTGEEISYHIRTVTAGYTFGELALIRDMKREFTAVCKGTSEFLSLSKGEFNQVMRERWEKECNIRFNFLRSCEYFLTWNDKQLQICADSSLLKEYTDNTVILGDDEAEFQSEGVYFIRKGRCDVVRRILVVRQRSPYLRPHLLLPETAVKSHAFLNKSYAKSRRIRRNEVHFLTVTTLHPGSFFGAGENLRDTFILSRGENLRDTFILSRGKTECVIINTAQFSIQGKSEQLRSLKRERENSLPSNKSLYNKFQENRRWYEYRNKLLQDILNRKRAKKAFCTISDVPKTIMKEPAIPRDLIYYR